MDEQRLRCRSVLNTCALYPHQYDKATELGADVGTLDLEDAVPEERKDDARRLALPFLAAASAGGAVRALRLNSLRTEHGLRDVLALLESEARPELILIPKVESPQEVIQLEQLLAAKLPSVSFAAIIETARGLDAVEAIVRATPRLVALVFGAADFASDLEMAMAWEPLLYARSRLVTAARLGGILTIDAPCFELDDPSALAEEVARGRRLGFAGKIAIHPHQIAALNTGFLPPPSAVAEAREVLRRHGGSAGAGNRGGISVLGGRMIGPPDVARARRLLATVREVGE